MKVQCYGTEFEIPDLLINKFVSEFNVLPGSGHREGVYQLRESISEILDLVAEDPEILHEKEYLSDFLKALAIKEAMQTLGILYDS